MATLALPNRSAVVQAVGLDVDGVLRDTAYQVYRSLCKAVRELGGSPPDHETFVRSYTVDFLPFYRACGVGAPKDEITQTFRKHHDVNDLVPPFHDVSEFLDNLRASGLAAFVVSSSRRERVQGWLATHGLYDKFAHVASASSDKVASLWAACRTLGVEPEQACYVGDLGCDMRDARKALLIPIEITRGYETRKALYECGAAIVVSTFAEFEEFLV